MPFDGTNYFRRDEDYDDYEVTITVERKSSFWPGFWIGVAFYILFRLI